MKEFKDILEVSPLGDGKNWILRDEFYYDYQIEGTDNVYRITVPEKFMTDYASTPRFLWSFIKPWGLHGMATVIHDWLYWEQEIPGWENLTKNDVEDIFRQCLKESKVSPRKTFLMYLAVKWFAKGAWNGNKKLRDEGWNRVALRWPTKASDRPEDLQTVE